MLFLSKPEGNWLLYVIQTRLFLKNHQCVHIWTRLCKEEVKAAEGFIESCFDTSQLPVPSKEYGQHLPVSGSNQPGMFYHVPSISTTYNLLCGSSVHLQPVLWARGRGTGGVSPQPWFICPKQSAWILLMTLGIFSRCSLESIPAFWLQTFSHMQKQFRTWPAGFEAWRCWRSQAIAKLKNYRSKTATWNCCVLSWHVCRHTSMRVGS